MRIGYYITIEGIILDSEDTKTADLISLMNTNDTTQSDYTLDIIINNKNLKYNDRVIVGDPVSVVVKLLDGNNLIYSKAIFNGSIQTVNWDYTSMHIIAGGTESGFNLESPATSRVYHNVAFFGDYLRIIEHLVEDYNSANPGDPIMGVFPHGSPSAIPTLDVYEVSDHQTIETVMDDLCHHLGMSYHTETIENKSYLMLMFSGASQSSEVVTRELGQGLIFDSAACNEIGYITEVVVHGVLLRHDADDRNLQGTKTCWGKAMYKSNKKVVRNIRVPDPNCHTQEACMNRAKAILQSGSAIKDVIKPVFTQCAPSVGSHVIYMDPLYKGTEIEGVVQRRELRISANEGWICTVELKVPTTIQGEPSVTSGYD
jgi:hypothetical protein